ncbi:hypothetical protein ANANG_G00099360 [Anguilla anguilla]|uniref:Uncharacterized protein n=1 Tax=Anguilla anguilla TaxID=7936 RepID=A0A9D3MGG3_ANGAN|nr:hypothetical protein ANANG_G00099360 [Anguilla anguilla]
MLFTSACQAHLVTLSDSESGQGHTAFEQRRLDLVSRRRHCTDWKRRKAFLELGKIRSLQDSLYEDLRPSLVIESWALTNHTVHLAD